MTKPRFTPDQHAEMGRALSGLRDELVHRIVQLHNAYPKTGPESTPAQYLDEAREAVDQARMALETLHFDEAPKTADTSTYYPHEDRYVLTAARPRRQ
ncbi:hypothetical protein [Streptomyces chilikensis]|uniref:Uncharacterized protein n=1 Tax=Streptomyces chilikensis TaxID=1194079 RepID=A0ABV3ERE6_9ACTN